MLFVYKLTHYMLWLCHEHTKTLALTMLLTNMYGMMHETPGSSVEAMAVMFRQLAHNQHKNPVLLLNILMLKILLKLQG